MRCDGVDGGHWRALPMVDVGGALGHPHDTRDDDNLPWHSSCACGAFLSLVEHYGWCSTCILCLHGEDALSDVLYPLDVDDDQQLKSEEGKHFIVESKLVQHEALASFHPDSVNTIRVVTVYDNKKDQLHFMFAKIRMGSNGAHLDNTHAGGISGNIDIETGVIITPGYSVLDKDGFIFHPTTGKQIVGFRIPYWQECKRFIEEVARVTPEIRYVGWDVVLMEDGEFALIEANDNADHDGQQIRYKGLWKEYKSLLKQLS